MVVPVNARTSRTPLVVWLSQFPMQDGWETLFEPWEVQRVRVAADTRGWIGTPPDQPPGLIFDGIARGQMVFIPQGCHDFKRSVRSRERVLQAVHSIHDDLRPDVLVLGSLTTSITDSGRLVAEYVDRQGWDTVVTTGDAGSVAALYNVVVDLLAGSQDTAVAIVGLGLIGTALLRLLTAMGQRRVLVVGTNEERTRRAVAGLELSGTEVAVTADMHRLAEAHLVVSVTSADRAILHPWMFPSPTVIIDPAVPPNVPFDPCWRAGGHVVYSGAAQLHVGDSLGTPSWRWGSRPGDCYACLCEGAAIATSLGLHPDTRRQHFVGAVDPQMVRWFDMWCRLVGWQHALLHMWDESVSLSLGREVLRERLALGQSDEPMSPESVLLS